MTPNPPRNVTQYRFEEPVFGQYIAQSQIIGQGGMGEVYVINEGHKLFAIKTIQPRCLSKDEKFFQALAIAEARIGKAASDVSFYFPTVYGTQKVEDFDSSGRPLTNVATKMDFIEGKDLEKRLADTNNPTDVRDMLRAFYHSLIGQRTLAQELGVINTDYKPSNIMYTNGKQVGRGQGKIIDVGIARLLDYSPLRISIPQPVLDIPSYGTIEYSSPKELAQKEDLGEALLQFKAGLVGYEIMTGKLFYDVLAQEHSERDFSSLPTLEKARVLFQIGNDHETMKELMAQAASQCIESYGLSESDSAKLYLNLYFNVLAQALDPIPSKRPNLSVIEYVTHNALDQLLKIEKTMPVIDQTRSNYAPTLVTLPPTMPLQGLYVA